MSEDRYERWASTKGAKAPAASAMGDWQSGTRLRMVHDSIGDAIRCLPQSEKGVEAVLVKAWLMLDASIQRMEKERAEQSPPQLLQ